jgi:hypothetical protein
MLTNEVKTKPQNHKNVIQIDIHNVIILPPPPQWLVRVCWLYATKAREKDKQEEKKKKKQHGERERERERTKRAARKDTARSASIADKAVAHFFKFQRRARRSTANAELQQLCRTSPAVLSMWPYKNYFTSKFSYFLSFFLSANWRERERERVLSPQYKGSFNTDMFV